MKDKRAYLSGKMRGEPDFNFPAFFEAAAVLKEHYGLVVHNPAEHDVWLRTDDGPTRAIHLDLAIIQTWAELVVVLPGWQHGTGTWAEVFTAQWVGLPVYEYGFHRAGPELRELDIAKAKHLAPNYFYTGTVL